MARRTRPPARARRPASPLVHLLVPVVAMLALGLMLGAAAWMVAVGLVASHTWDSLLSGHDPEEVVGGFTLVMALVGLHLGGLRSLKTRAVTRFPQLGARLEQLDYARSQRRARR